MSPDTPIGSRVRSTSDLAFRTSYSGSRSEGPAKLTICRTLCCQSRYIASVPEVFCARCGSSVGDEVVFVSHRGGPQCRRCTGEALVARLVRQTEREAVPNVRFCDGECGRMVIELRTRRPVVMACSTNCRRAAYNSRRQVRRAEARTSLQAARCRHCDGPLPSPRRADCEYCSSRCRVAAFRRRRTET